MTTDQIAERILSECPKISKSEIAERLEKERGKTNGLISDEILLRMVAAEFGVKIENNEPCVPTLSAADLVPGLNNVTVVGRVVAVFPPKAFSGRRSGKFASFLVADQRGILRVVLWNDKVSLVESGQVKAGQVVRVSHGYTKDGTGRVELHVGERCRIEVDPQGIETDDYPTIDKFTTKICEITHAHGNLTVNVEGVVEKVISASTFERQDASVGKVMHFVLADETGKVSVVAWNEKVDELEEMLVDGMGLRLVNARIKRRFGESLEAHVDSGTYLETFLLTDAPAKAADLR